MPKEPEIWTGEVTLYAMVSGVDTDWWFSPHPPAVQTSARAHLHMAIKQSLSFMLDGTRAQVTVVRQWGP